MTLTPTGVRIPVVIMSMRVRTGKSQALANAGTWTVGVSVSGNAMGLPLADWQGLQRQEQAQRREAASARLQGAGAHYVIDSIADLLPVLDQIQQRLARGESPR